MLRRRFLKWCGAMILVPCLDWQSICQPRMTAKEVVTRRLTLPEAFAADFVESILRMADRAVRA